MDWNRVEGNWKQLKGNIKEQWGKLTDDDLNVIDGRRDQLEGKISRAVRIPEGSGPQGGGRLVYPAALVTELKRGDCPRSCSRQEARHGPN